MFGDSSEPEARRSGDAEAERSKAKLVVTVLEQAVQVGWGARWQLLGGILRNLYFIFALRRGRRGSSTVGAWCSATARSPTYRRRARWPGTEWTVWQVERNKLVCYFPHLQQQRER